MNSRKSKKGYSTPEEVRRLPKVTPQKGKINPGKAKPGSGGSNPPRTPQRRPAILRVGRIPSELPSGQSKISCDGCSLRHPSTERVIELSDAKLRYRPLASLICFAATNGHWQSWDRDLGLIEFNDRGLPEPWLVWQSLKGDVTKAFVLKETFQRAAMALDSLLLWLEMVGFEVGGEKLDWAVRVFDKFYVAFLLGIYEPWMKYITAVVQYELLDESSDCGVQPDPPKRPPFVLDTDKHFLRGRAYLWFLARTGSGATTLSRLSLANAIGSLKKRQPGIPQFRVDAAVDSWRSSVFGYTNDGRFDDPQWVDAFSGSCRWVDRIVNHLFPRRRLPDGLPWFNIPHGAVPKAPTVKARLADPVSLATESESEWLTQVAVDSFKAGEVPHLRSCLTVNDANGAIDFSSGLFLSGLQRKLDVALGRDHRSVAASSKNDYYRVGAGSDYMSVSHEPLLVKPVGLPEPFKARVISVAGPDVSFIASQLQPLLTNAMGRLHQLSLTRECPIIRIHGHASKVFRGDLVANEFWVSGDYTASTDNIDPAISDYIVERISDKLELDVHVRSLFRRLLTGHVTVGPDGSRLPQTWGQLMGSPVSFPVLCIANLAMTAYALYRDSPMPLEMTRILVNGDDVAFPATPQQYQRWRNITSQLGLRPSPGKNFVSKKFFQLNSMMLTYAGGAIYRVPGSGRLTLGSAPLFSIVPQYHLAVLSPPRRVGDDELFGTCDSWCKKLTQDHSPDVQERLVSLFVLCWKEELKRISLEGRLNWFLPRELGGLGLTVTDGFVFDDSHITVPQRKLATFLLGSRDERGQFLSKVRRYAFPAATNVHKIATGLEASLVKSGWLEWAPGPSGFSLKGLAFSVAVSGSMSHFRSVLETPDERAARKERHNEPDRVTASRRERIWVTSSVAKIVSGESDKTRSPSTLNWKLLKKSQSVPLSMIVSVKTLRDYVPERLFLHPRPGVTVRPCGVQIDYHTMCFAPQVSSFVLPDPSSQSVVINDGFPLLARAWEHSKMVLPFHLTNA